MKKLKEKELNNNSNSLLNNKMLFQWVASNILNKAMILIILK